MIPEIINFIKAQTFKEITVRNFQDQIKINKVNKHKRKIMKSMRDREL